MVQTALMLSFQPRHAIVFFSFSSLSFRHARLHRLSPIRFSSPSVLSPDIRLDSPEAADSFHSLCRLSPLSATYSAEVLHVSPRRSTFRDIFFQFSLASMPLFCRAVFF